MIHFQISSEREKEMIRKTLKTEENTLFDCQYCPPILEVYPSKYSTRLPPTFLDNNDYELNQDYLKNRSNILPKYIFFKFSNLIKINRCSVCQEMPPSVRNKIIPQIKIARKNRLHFNKMEIAVLLEVFFCICQDGMTADQFKKFLSSNLGITNLNSLDGLVKVALQESSQNVQLITADAFLKVLSTLLRGSIDERSELVFKVMDFDNDGYLKKTIEFKQLTKDSFIVEIAATNPEADPEEPSREMTNYICDKLNISPQSPINMSDFKEKIRKYPQLMESLLPIIPKENVNIIFQKLFTTNVHIPSLI